MIIGLYHRQAQGGHFRRSNSAFLTHNRTARSEREATIDIPPPFGANTCQMSRRLLQLMYCTGRLPLTGKRLMQMSHQPLWQAMDSSHLKKKGGFFNVHIHACPFCLELSKESVMKDTLCFSSRGSLIKKKADFGNVQDDIPSDMRQKTSGNIMSLKITARFEMSGN